MRVKNIFKRIIKSFVREVKCPVYIPVLEGSILQGKTVLITGGASGIGYAIAKQALANKAEVVLVGRDETRLINARKALENV